MLGFLCWHSAGTKDRASRCAQLVALGMLALILFPVISITDDFWAWQNPAEADTCLRRTDLLAHPHAPVQEFAIPPARQTAELQVAVPGWLLANQTEVPIPEPAARSVLSGRPPPQS